MSATLLILAGLGALVLMSRGKRGIPGTCPDGIARWAESDQQRMLRILKTRSLVLKDKRESPFIATYEVLPGEVPESLANALTMIHGASAGLRLHVLADAQPAYLAFADSDAARIYAPCTGSNLRQLAGPGEVLGTVTPGTAPPSFVPPTTPPGTPPTTPPSGWTLPPGWTIPGFPTTPPTTPPGTPPTTPPGTPPTTLPGTPPATPPSGWTLPPGWTIPGLPTTPPTTPPATPPTTPPGTPPGTLPGTPPTSIPPGAVPPTPPTTADPCTREWIESDLDANMAAPDKQATLLLFNNKSATSAALVIAAQGYTLKGYPKAAGIAAALAKCRESTIPPIPATPPQVAWRFKLRWADTPYLLAAYYVTGDRWREILAVNPGMKTKQGTKDGKPITYVEPWGGGRIINLPSDWPVDKKPIPVAGTTKASAVAWKDPV